MSAFEKYWSANEITGKWLTVKGAVKVGWDAAIKYMEAQNTSTNSAMDAISAIEGAIRIKDIWLPPAGTVDEEHEAEIKALWDMYRTFLNITQKQHQ